MTPAFSERKVAALFIVALTFLNHHIHAFPYAHPNLVCNARYCTKGKPGTFLSSKMTNDSDDGSLSPPINPTRRNLILQSTALAIIFSPTSSLAITTSNSGNLPDLPPDAVRSYLQYRYVLQTAADYYLFELHNMISDTDRWGEVGDLFRTSSGRGSQGQPNRIEREFVNPMRILGLAMPPDADAEGLELARFRFERAMAKISGATVGIRKDLPVEIDKSLVVKAEEGWEEGRLGLNDFFVGVNRITGLEGELRLIPPNGKDQLRLYGRSASKFNVMMKKIKLCQNRGGPTLSQAWGQLMISGYMQDSCGIPDLEDYFFQ